MQRVRGLGQSLLLGVPRCIQRSLGFLLLGFRSFPDGLVVGIPVSYTHLDVYKRQRQLSASFFC